MMRFDEILGEIDVCEDCMFDHANGEINPDRDPNEPQPWALWGFGYDVTMGGTHSDECPNRDAVVHYVECDCDVRGFSWQSCEGCGSSLGGDRYRFTAWRTFPSVAHGYARTALEAARTARANGDRAASLSALTLAAEWRAYLSAIADSDRRFRIAMARYAERSGIAA